MYARILGPWFRRLVAGNRGLHADDEEDRISPLGYILPPRLFLNRQLACRDNGQFMTGELRYAIPRSVELCFGVGSAGEKNFVRALIFQGLQTIYW